MTPGFDAVLDEVCIRYLAAHIELPERCRCVPVVAFEIRPAGGPTDGIQGEKKIRMRVPRIVLVVIEIVLERFRKVREPESIEGRIAQRVRERKNPGKTLAVIQPSTVRVVGIEP